jgi:hypothetical protein
MADRVAIGGWDLEHQLKPGGLVLNNVSNHGFPLATDIRLARVWMAAPGVLATVDPKHYWKDVTRRSFVPGTPDLPSTGPVSRLDRVRPPGDFGIYPVDGGLSATFETATALPKVRNDRLTITQRYLFGPYSKNPPHEPGAVLLAARMFPLLDFKVTPGPERLPGPSYFRADFRFELALNGFGLDQAGIFRDSETVPTPTISIGPRLNLPGLAAVFAGAEKPLHHELIGYGLTERNRAFGGSVGADKQTWDNYHQFPKAADGSLPSTPGAFHCLHLHWRWGAVSAQGNVFPPLQGGTQFRGLGWTPQVGGPLIDPAIASQDLTFAVTTDSGPGTPWAADANASEWLFPDLFTGRRAQPLPVKNGAKLTLWMSFEVAGPDGRNTEPWGGTLFPHGMYFAHSAEPSVFLNLNPAAGPITPILGAAGGLHDPLVKESVSETASPMPWTRYPPGSRR